MSCSSSSYTSKSSRSVSSFSQSRSSLTLPLLPFLKVWWILTGSSFIFSLSLFLFFSLSLFLLFFKIFSSFFFKNLFQESLLVFLVWNIFLLLLFLILFLLLSKIECASAQHSAPLSISRFLFTKDIQKHVNRIFSSVAKYEISTVVLINDTCWFLEHERFLIMMHSFFSFCFEKWSSYISHPAKFDIGSISL